MWLYGTASCLFIFCLWCLILINLSAASDTVDHSLLDTLSSLIPKETTSSPHFLPTSVISPPQSPLPALPPQLTLTWVPFSSLNALMHRSIYMPDTFQTTMSSPGLSLELWTHISSCLFDKPTSPQGCLTDISNRRYLTKFLTTPHYSSCGLPTLLTALCLLSLFLIPFSNSWENLAHFL